MKPSTTTLASVLRRGAKKGFSLIEVVLAIGVVAFAFVPMFGLLPVGLTTFRQSIETTVGSQIAQQLINQAQETDFATLTSQQQYPTDYFDEQGNQLPSSTGAVYTASVTVASQTSLPDSIATISTNLATVSVRVAHNPANVPMTGPNAVPSTVYSAHIARNL